MTAPRVPLFDRLPEIYRTRDIEQARAVATGDDTDLVGPLRAYLAAIEHALGAVHADIASLHRDLFIETCADWVVPYIADLLGTSHLKGDPWTLRADVADTIALRRRKGTLGAIERLAANLTAWACRAVELRDNLAWTQHVNHPRPDAGGAPPAAAASATRLAVPRGGTVPVRDPAALALLGTPFDPFAYSADTRPAVDDARHVNLPNLAIFLWRLAAYRLPLTLPLARGFDDLGAPAAGSDDATFAVRLDLHPLDRPLRLFNTHRAGFRRADVAGGAVQPLTDADAVPGPMPGARLSTDADGGNPAAYVAVDFYDDGAATPGGFDLGDVGLQLYLPASIEALLTPPPGATAWRWRFRGDNLCAWAGGLRRRPRIGEIVVDPDIGRVLIGVADALQRDALIAADGAGFRSRVWAGVTYAAVGPVGAHPVTRGAADPDGAERRQVGGLPGQPTLQDALAGLEAATTPVVVEITDSLVHPLDLGGIAGTAVDGGRSLRLAHSLVVRATAGARPTIVLAGPLGFRPVDAAAARPGTPAVAGTPSVTLAGVVIARGAAFPAGEPLIARAAVARLDIVGCTLEPGGHRQRDGSRAPMAPSLRLANDHGFAAQADVDAFVPTPDVVIQRSITGSIAVDDRHLLQIESTIVDAGAGVGDPPAATPAIGAATDPAGGWAAPLAFDGITVFGAVRVTSIGGDGGLFAQRLQVLDDQSGCIKWSWFRGDGDRLPPNSHCLRAADAPLAFVAEWFDDPAYGQIARSADDRVRTLGPADDAMGATGFLLEAHKWANLTIRLREFMPVGVRPLVVPVT